MSVATERSEVEAAAIEYFESWFDGDAERMGRILHRDLCKRAVRDRLSFTNREQMVEWTAAGNGMSEAAGRSLDVVVLDVHGDADGASTGSPRDPFDVVGLVEDALPVRSVGVRDPRAAPGGDQEFRPVRRPAH